MTLFQILTALSPLLCWLGIALPVTVSVTVWVLRPERMVRPIDRVRRWNGRG